MKNLTENTSGRPVKVAAGALRLDGHLSIPENACGVVLMAQGSMNIENDSAYSDIAGIFNDAELATLLVHLLTEEEETLDKETQFFRFNVDILHQRIIGITNWLIEEPETHNLSIGYFGSGPAGAAALIAAAKRPDPVHAIVVGNGRLDLAQAYLSRVLAPTFLIVGGNDSAAVNANREAFANIPAKVEANKRFETISGTTGLFDTPEILRKVAEQASAWFTRYLEPIV
jgi:dienelactone hydrolase